jgi:uncharacterized repeat protein (TIGR03803 family)
MVRLAIGVFIGLICAATPLQLVEASGAAKERVLHSFGKGDDGAGPDAALTNVGGVLYSTTGRGGNLGYGTLFEINPQGGQYGEAYSFCSQGAGNCTDGAGPYANALTYDSRVNTMYGTAYGGGLHNGGVIYSAFPESVIYSFCSRTGCSDGYIPYAGLLQVNDILYGTTELGGTNGDGVVFAYNLTTRTQRVVYSFCSKKNCADGRSSYSSLVRVDGMLYGTTFYGGNACYDRAGCGVLRDRSANEHRGS